MAEAVKRMKKLLCGLLSAVMMVMPCLPVSAAAAGAEAAGSGAMPTKSEYFPYYDANARVPFLTESSPTVLPSMEG